MRAGAVANCSPSKRYSHNFAITAESVKSYNELLITARAGLEDRLERMNGRLEFTHRNIPGSGVDADEARRIKEERQSMEKCLQICADVS